MKNNDEMYRSVLSRREEYRRKKEKRIRTIRRTVPVLACFCFTVVYGLRFWDDLARFSRDPIQPNIVNEPMTENTESTAAADTTESSLTEQAIIADAVSTTISVQNPEEDMAADTGANQTQTVTTAAAVEESSGEAEHETIEHTETQAPVTTAPVVETKPVIVAQTTAPVQTASEAAKTVVNKPEPTITATTKPSGTVHEPVDPPPPPITTKALDIAYEPSYPPTPAVATKPHDEQAPVDSSPIIRPSVDTSDTDTNASPAQPIPFDDITAAAAAIYNNDVSSYPVRTQEAYLRMFERLRNDGFVYQVSDNELILREDQSLSLFPYAAFEDIGIGYFVTYKEKLYRVMFYYADPYVISGTDSIGDYLRRRMGRRSDKEIIIQDQTVSELITDDGRIYASSFIDSNHYYDIVTSAPEDELMEFLNIFSYEQIQL